MLAELADQAGLAEALDIGVSEAKAGVAHLANVLADAMEALIGALYLDSGFDPARDFVRRIWGPELDAMTEPPTDPKTELQEWLMARGLPLPEYRVAARSRPFASTRIRDDRVRQWPGGRRHRRQQTPGRTGRGRRPPSQAAKQMTESSCGFAAIVGAPNAGKSTLLNRLTGAKLSIVSPKAQTTRFRVLGVLMRGPTQILLVDTPGIFQPKRKLDRAMVKAAWTGAEDADLTLLIVDSRAGATPDVRDIAASLAKRNRRVWLVLNKIDLIERQELLPLTAAMPRGHTDRTDLHGLGRQR